MTIQQEEIRNVAKIFEALQNGNGTNEEILFTIN